MPVRRNRRPLRLLGVSLLTAIAVAVAGCSNGKPEPPPPAEPSVTPSVTPSASPGPEPLLSLVEKTALTMTRKASGAYPSVSLKLNWEFRGSGLQQAFYRNGLLQFFLRGVVRIGATANAPACSANLSALPAQQLRPVRLELPGVIDANYHLYMGHPDDVVVSDGLPRSECNYASTRPGRYGLDYEPASSDVKYPVAEAAIAPQAVFEPSATPATQNFRFAANLNPITRVTINTTLTFTAGANPTMGPEGPPKVSQAVKDAARDAARAELSASVYPCAVSLAGASIFGVMGPAIGPVTGSTLFAVAAPVCANQIVIINNLSRTVVDPPVADYTVIARVPDASPSPIPLSDCNSAPAEDRAYCTRLHAAVQAWAAALQHEADVATALSTTVGRSSAAASAGNLQAATAQVQAATDLLPQLAAARQDEGRLGAALAAVVRTDRANGAVSATTTGSAYDAIVRSLTSQGTAEADVRATLGDALTPQPLDVLSTIATG